MIAMQKVHRLAVESEPGVFDGHRQFVQPAGWNHLRTDGGCLAFFTDNDGRKFALSHFVWEGSVWVHASVSRESSLPTYADLCELHRCVFGERFSAQMFVPRSHHVNIHPFCLHLWGPDDPNIWPLPRFKGTI